MSRIGRCLLFCSILFIPISFAYAGNARGNFAVIHPGDSPLQTKCRSEAALVGGGHGKGAAQHALETRKLRKEHFKKCMYEG